MGCVLVVDGRTAREVRARIVEVEAYLGLDDPASHAARGPTPRAAIMFGEPAHLYVYLSYGLHHCANLVTEPAGRPGAVLLRAAAVEMGEETVRGRRAAAVQRRRPPVADSRPLARPLPAAALLRGPGNLCSGLGLTLADNGLDVESPGSRLQVVLEATAPPLAVGPRVGISLATGAPLRFCWAGHEAVSSPAVGTGAREHRRQASAPGQKGP